MLLSVIIPVYNEERYIYQVLQNVNNVVLPYGITKQFIIVNDGSTDNSNVEITKFISEHPMKDLVYMNCSENFGKGSAVAKALTNVAGEMVIIHDGDLEYDPSNWNLLINEMITKNAELILGNRFGKTNPIIRNKYYFGNKLITFFFNLVSGTKFSDVETCSKLFKASAVKKFQLFEKRFGFEIEFMRKMVKGKSNTIFEVDILYNPRNRSEGKKIGFSDGFRALFCMLKY